MESRFRIALRFCLLAVVMVAGTQAVSAQDVPRRPVPLIEEFLLARRVTVEDQGDLEVSLAGRRRQESPARSAVDLEYGLTDRLQLQIEAPLHTGDAAEADPSAGFMYALRASESGPQVSAGFEVALGKQGDEIRGVASRVEPFITASQNAGVAVLQFDAAYARGNERQLAWNFAAVCPWRRWRGLIEVNHGESPQRGSYVIAPGVVWKGPARLELALGALLSVHGARSEKGLVLKLTREFDLR